MQGGDWDTILQQMESAIGRIEGAVRADRGDRDLRASDDDLRASNARLREAVGAAIVQIDGLIAAAGAPRANGSLDGHGADGGDAG